jgi:hypothetical protein
MLSVTDLHFHSAGILVLLIQTFAIPHYLRQPPVRYSLNSLLIRPAAFASASTIPGWVELPEIIPCIYRSYCSYKVLPLGEQENTRH